MFLAQFYTGKKKPDEIEAILINLKNILNVKKGFGSFLRELGVGDYNAYRSHKATVHTIIEEITQNIALFEPRVQMVSIREIQADSSFRLRFELTCTIVDNPQPIYLIFDSVNHHFAVEN
jgi:predicted component of type VI protein secretion system